MRALALMTSMLISACGGGDSDRQEQINKLRALGVSVTPLVSTPSVMGEAPHRVELVIHAALPLGQTAEIEAFKDLESFSVVVLDPSEIEIQADSIAYQAYAGFQLVSFKALVNVPPAARFARTAGAGQVRYGFRITSGSEVEKLVGNFLVYPEASPELSWQNPQVSFATPSEGAVLAPESEVDLKAELTELNGEELKIAWFTSGGKIANRRAKSSKWTSPEAGPHTLLVTVRGKKSRGFNMQLINVKVE